MIILYTLINLIFSNHSKLSSIKRRQLFSPPIRILSQYMIIQQIKNSRAGGIFTPLERRSSTKWTEQQPHKRYCEQPLNSQSNFKTRSFSEINNGCSSPSHSYYKPIACESNKKIIDHIMGEVKQIYKSQSIKKNRKNKQRIVKNKSVSHNNHKQEQIVYKQSISRALQKILWIEKKNLQGNDITTPFHNRKLANLNKTKLIGEGVKVQYMQKQSRGSTSNKAQQDAQFSENSLQPHRKAFGLQQQEFDDAYLPSQSRRLTSSKEKTKTEQMLEPSASTHAFQHGLTAKSPQRKGGVRKDKLMFTQGTRAISARQMTKYPQCQVVQRQIRFSQGQQQSFLDKNQREFPSDFAMSALLQKRLIFLRKKSNNLRREHLKQDRMSIRTHQINRMGLGINL